LLRRAIALAHPNLLACHALETVLPAHTLSYNHPGVTRFFELRVRPSATISECGVASQGPRRSLPVAALSPVRYRLHWHGSLSVAAPARQVSRRLGVCG